jgi:hypothetical protein
MVLLTFTLGDADFSGHARDGNLSLHGQGLLTPRLAIVKASDGDKRLELVKTGGQLPVPRQPTG